MGRTGDSLEDESSPRIAGKKPSLRRSPFREEAGWPLVEMTVVVVVVTCVATLKVQYSLNLYSVTCFTKMRLLQTMKVSRYQEWWK